MNKINTFPDAHTAPGGRGFRHARSLGQNFLADESIIDEIVAGSMIGPADLVIEIGPGMGVLTAAAAEQAARVVAIEIDQRLIPILHQELADYDNIEIINQDIMKTDLNEVISTHLPPEGGPVRIIGNLPYYITTPIVMKLLEEHVAADSITIMVQKEVAERLLAAPGTKACGAISASVSYYCTVTHITDAPRSAFIPRPNVDSAVIRLDIRKEPPVQLTDEKLFFETIKYGFGQRRKTLSNSLTGLGGLSRDEIGTLLDATGIDRKRRAETLSLAEFAAFANAAAAMKRERNIR